MKKFYQLFLLLICTYVLSACDSNGNISVEEESISSVEFVDNQMLKTSDEAVPVDMTTVNIDWTNNEDDFNHLFNQ